MSSDLKDVSLDCYLDLVKKDLCYFSSIFRKFRHPVREFARPSPEAFFGRVFCIEYLKNQVMPISNTIRLSEKVHKSIYW